MSGARDAPGLDKNHILTNRYSFLSPGIHNSDSTKTQPRPCLIESNALRLLAPLWPSSAAVPPTLMADRGMTAAITDMETDPQWFNRKCRLALAALTARRITTSVVATAPAITASQTGTNTGARITARIPRPAQEDRITRRRRSARRGAHREAHQAAPLMEARRADAQVVPRRRRPATTADSTVAATAVGPVVETTVRPAMATASVPTRIDPARTGLSNTAQIGRPDWPRARP